MANLGNMYPNLPGMLVEFKDGGQALKFDEQEINTDSMLILGTAIDGPVMEPVAVDDNSAELLFGSELKDNGSPNGSTLLKAFKVARDNGCQDIRLMRISGSQASATIHAPSQEDEVEERADENLGYTEGNGETSLKLAGTGVIASTVEIYAKGKKMDTKFVTVDPNASGGTNIEIVKNACDAGSILTINYDYERAEKTVDSDLVPDNTNKLFLSKDPVSGTVKVKPIGGDYLEESAYSVNGRIVTIGLNSGDTAVVGKAVAGKTVVGKSTVKSVVLSDTTYIVEYEYMEKGNSTETTDKDGNLLAASTGEQKVVLSGSPRGKDEVSLYIDNNLVLDTNTYTVDIENKCILLKKEYFPKEVSISVSYFTTKKRVVKKEVTISSIFGGDVYNESKIEVIDIKDNNGASLSKAIRLTKPNSKLSTGEEPLVFTAYAFETLGALVEAINTYSGIFVAETNAPDEKTSSLVFNETYFRGGNDGLDLNKEELFMALSGKRDINGYLEKQGAYQLLENYQVDWVVPTGIYADDKLLDRNKDFAYELALFCAINSTRNKSVYGAIPMKQLTDTSLAGIQAHAKYLANFKNQYFMKDNKGSIITDGKGVPIDLGKFITLIAGPTVTVNHQVYSLREDAGAVAYIAYNTVLLPQSAPTNKRLPGTNGVKYNFSNAQLNDIAGNRMVVFGKKFSSKGQVLQGAYIVDGPTCARVGSEYGRLSTLKVLREVSDQTREVADPFIGEANTIEQRNALSAALSKRYDALVSSGVILDYSFNLVASQRDQALGQSSLELGIVAPQELRKITTVMGLKR